MRRYAFFTSLLVLASVSYFNAQQADQWYFGNHVGLDFSNGAPVEVGEGQTSEYDDFHTEGSACISDATGELLFYSNGMQVWNKNHEIMPSGADLAGHHSSTHAALILPVPGSDHRYFLFVSDSFVSEPQTGPKYYVVDMCLDNGLGDIDLAFGEQTVQDEFTEKMAVAEHANGIDYWLVTQVTLSNEFRAFHVTSVGLSLPVSSFVGQIHADDEQPGIGVAIGQMKISPDGERLALTAANGLEFAEVFDFNTLTGEVSNPITLNIALGGYGVAFSPDVSKLYVRGAGGLFQFDLEAGSDYAINQSKTLIETGGTNQLSGLQLGPDGKIYAIAYFNSSISVIHSPNSFYPDCDFELHYIVLENQGLSYSFPSFLDSFNYPDVEADCSGTIVSEISGLECTVFPNPAQGAVYFTYQVPTNAITNFELVDALGQTHQLSSQRSANGFALELGETSPGFYLIRVISEQNVAFSVPILVEK